MDWLIYAVAGVVSGFLGGLLGIGGGLVIVPALLLVFAWMGVGAEVATHLAIGSSFGVILFTSLASILTHHQLDNVDWATVKPMSVGILLGTGLGVALVSQVPSEYLQMIIGIYAWLMAARVLIKMKPNPRPFPSPKALTVAGVGVGWLSSWFGIGGGTLTVPLLTWWSMPTVRAVGTAATCGFPVAFSAAMFNAGVGWSEPLLPAGSTGYVYWPAVIALACFSAPSARLGARFANRLPEIYLKHIFAGFLLIIGVRFLFFAG
jgi:uncharacterized membrane protein YfcA